MKLSINIFKFTQKNLIKNSLLNRICYEYYFQFADIIIARYIINKTIKINTKNQKQKLSISPLRLITNNSQLFRLLLLLLLILLLLLLSIGLNLIQGVISIHKFANKLTKNPFAHCIH